MAESGNGVKPQTLYISIAVSLLVGFLAGIIYSDRSPQGGGQFAPPQQQFQAQQQQQAQLEQTIANLQLQTQQNPNNAEAWTRLGHAYFDSNQPAKAIEAYNKALEIIPGNPPVLTDLGVMYRRNGQPEKAVESFNKALEIQPNFEQALFNKGVVLYNDLGDVEGALQAWRRVVEINPNATGPSGARVAELIENIAQQAGGQ